MYLSTENKSSAHRDHRKANKASECSLSITFYEENDMGIDGIIVQPAAGYDNLDLELVEFTLAKISQACAFHPAIGINATPRDVELLHELSLLNYDVITYSTEQIYDADHP